MHEHKEMWWIIPCLILLGLLFVSGSQLSSSWYLWLIVIGVCVVPHIWMMFKGHGGHKKHSDVNPEDKEDNKHEHGECCH